MKRSATIYAQGNPADSVFFVQKGTIRLSVLAGSGKEAVVGVIGPGEFFGEGALAGQPVRLRVSMRAIDESLGQTLGRLHGDPAGPISDVSMLGQIRSKMPLA